MPFQNCTCGYCVHSPLVRERCRSCSRRKVMYSRMARNKDPLPPTPMPRMLDIDPHFSYSQLPCSGNLSRQPGNIIPFRDTWQEARPQSRILSNKGQQARLTYEDERISLVPARDGSRRDHSSNYEPRVGQSNSEKIPQFPFAQSPPLSRQLPGVRQERQRRSHPTPLVEVPARPAIMRGWSTISR